MEGRQRGESTQEREGCCRKMKERGGTGGRRATSEEGRKEAGEWCAGMR